VTTPDSAFPNDPAPSNGSVFPDDPIPSKSRDALIRESKDHLAIDVIELCRELHIRAMLGGAPVLNVHGLIAPGISRFASLVVDPASIRHLREALLAHGWIDANPRPGFRLLPSARMVFRHPDEAAGLIIYSVIPGFYADPEVTFDLIWERHKEVPLRGHTVRAMGRLNSAILASHDGLDGRASRARSNFDYFVDQFSRVLTERDREITVDFIRRMGGCAEMHRLIIALGHEPCPFTLPSVAYVRWRLQVTEVSDQLRRAVALAELGPEGRQLLYASRSGRPHSVRDVVLMFRSLPSTVTAILGARRRWARALLYAPE
jgi:hypothetical protein